MITTIYFVYFRPEECIAPRRSGEEIDNVKKLKTAVALKMLASASREIVPHALQLLPSTKVKLIYIYFFYCY